MRVCLSILITLIIACSVTAQEPDKAAIAAFDKLTNNCSGSGTVIESERKRLGNRFETELLRYLDTDIEKHYWLVLKSDPELEPPGKRPIDLGTLKTSGSVRSIGRFARRSNSVGPRPK